MQAHWKSYAPGASFIHAIVHVRTCCAHCEHHTSARTSRFIRELAGQASRPKFSQSPLRHRAVSIGVFELLMAKSFPSSTAIMVSSNSRPARILEILLSG